MKAKVFVKKDGKYWTTNFTIGVQTFRIDNGGERSKGEALWFKKCLETALSNLTEKRVTVGVRDTFKKITIKGKKA